MMYSAYKLNKQGDNIQPWCTPFPIWNQSVIPCPVLTVVSWTACRFLKRQIRWSGIPISFRIFQSAYTWTNVSSRNRIKRNNKELKIVAHMWSWGRSLPTRYKKGQKPSCHFWNVPGTSHVPCMITAQGTTKGKADLHLAWHFSSLIPEPTTESESEVA